MKFKIFNYKSVTSTNDMAIILIKEKKKEIGCVYAQKQTKGRGRYGREWISAEGNLFGSIFFQLKKNYPSFSEFSTINPVIISDIIKRYCENENITFKWPNDILVNGRKICGILQELVTLSSKRFLIIGIGINTVSSPNINYEHKTTNIYLETKKKPSTKDMINLIILSYEKFFLNLKSYSYLNFKRKLNQ